MKTLRTTKVKGWYELYRELCPVCGKQGGCMVNEKADRIACIRETSKHPFSTSASAPSWLHFLNKDKHYIDTSNVKKKAIQGEKKKENKTLNRVYRSLLLHTELNDDHFANLQGEKRQMTLNQINAREYRSSPSKPWNVTQAVMHDLNVKELKGIPGLYLHEKDNHTFWNMRSSGMLIPFRNYRNEIVGFQTRQDHVKLEPSLQKSAKGRNLMARYKESTQKVQVLDQESGEIVFEEPMDKGVTKYISNVKNEHLGFVRLSTSNRYFWMSSQNQKKGTSPSPLPIHVSIPTKELVSWEAGEAKQKKAIWLSEGPLKCDIASDFITRAYSHEEVKEIGDTFLAVPGVQSWPLVLPTLEKMGVQRVNLAFDADAISNPSVKKALSDCAKELRDKGFELYLAIWNSEDGNGIDDLFIQRCKPTFKQLSK